MAADRAATLAVAAGSFVLAVLLQAWGGAFRSEFGAHPDESAHYVTGVMVREYLASLGSASPLEFARDYYAHYPKVAIGHWPPGFYLLQAAWTLPLSPSRIAVLLLMAALTAALATTLFVTLRREAGGLAAAAAAGLFVALPLVQKASAMVMAEIPVALFCLWAMLAFGRFLDQGRAVDAVLSALAAAAAVLTKGNAFALALAAPLAVVLTRRWARLARPAPWASGLLAVALFAPWYLFTSDLAASNFAAGPPTIGYTLAAAQLYTPALVLAGGAGLALLAAAGVTETVVRPWRRRAVGGRWAAAAALALATWVFHCVVPSSREPRHMVMALPALTMFVGVGIAALARWAGGRAGHPARWRAAVVAMAVALFLANGFAVPAKAWAGFAAAADLLLRSPSGGPSVTLIVADVRGEGMFISEVAAREPRPLRTILRGSKVLAESGWDGEGYRLLHRTPAEVLAFLAETVEVVVLDTSADTSVETHPRLLRETLRSHSGRFENLGYFPLTRAGQRVDRAIEVWRLRREYSPVSLSGDSPSR